MPKIKACTSGKIKGKRIFNWENLDFTDLRISGDCLTCEIYPDPVLAGGLVYLGIEDTYEFSFEGTFEQYTFENFAGNRITPKWGANIEGIAGAGAAHYISNQIFGKSYEHIEIYMQLGIHSFNTEKLIDIQAPIKWKCWGTLPIRLFANIREFGRYHSTGDLWGKTGLEPGETVDTRGYLNADLDWYWWTPEGGEINFEVNGEVHQLTENGSTKPTIVLMAGAEQRGFNQFGSLTCKAWNNPEYQTRTSEYWHTGDPDTEKGVRYRAEGYTQSIQPIGAASDARNFLLSSGRLQPVKKIKITAAIENVRGFSWEPETFTVSPYDAPVISGYPLPISYVYPVGSTDSLSFEAPNQIEREGIEYFNSAVCWLDTVTNIQVESYHINTANEVALAFALEPSELESWGQDKNLWRVPLTLPGLSRWESFRVDSYSKKPIDSFTVLKWGGLAGTSLAVVNGVLKVFGANPEADNLTITRAYPKEENTPFGDSRYLQFDISCQNETDFTLKTDNGKEFHFSLQSGRTIQTIDLLASFMAENPDYTSTKKEALENPNWGWGLELPVTLYLNSTGAFDLYEVALVTVPEVPSISLSATHIHRNDSRFFVREVEIGLNTYEDYLRRQYVYVPEGRTAYDLPSGTIRQEVGFQGEDKAVNQYTLEDLIKSTKETEPKGMRVFKNLTPKNDFQFMGWGGTFIWYEPEAYFHNGKAAYFLEEGFKRVFGEAITEYAHYTVDRIKLGIGASLDTVFKRIIGTGFCGITLTPNRQADALLVSTITGNPSALSSYPGGVYLIPSNSHNLNTTGNYGLYYNYIGEPIVTNLWQGFIGRASIVKE